MKRNSVFQCLPVQERKLSATPCDILRTSSIILVFLIFAFDIMEIKRNSNCYIVLKILVNKYNVISMKVFHVQTDTWSHPIWDLHMPYC